MNTIDLTKLRNAAYLQMMKDYCAIVDRNSPATLNVQAKLDTLKAKVDEMDALFKKMMGNKNTAVLAGLDEKRDNCINGLLFVTQGYEYHFDEAVRDAAQKLAASIRLYGSGIAKQSYQAETATLTALIADWENKPELVDAVAYLRVADWLAEMKMLNNEFGEIYLNRTQEYGDASPENLFNKRQETNAVYYALRDRIDALHLLIEAPQVSPYSTVINQLNALTDQYNTLITGQNFGGGDDAPPVL